MSDTLRVRVNDRWYTVEAVDVDSEPAVVLVDGERVEVSLGEPLIRAEAPPSRGAMRLAEQPQPTRRRPHPLPRRPRADAPSPRRCPASSCPSRCQWETR